MPDAAGRYRPVWAEIDLGAVRSNVAALREYAAPATVLSVVKADGYGHGAVPVARAALEAGAAWLGVALVEEGVELRSGGIDAPVLVLSEPPRDAAGAVVEHALTPVVYTREGIESLAKAAAGAGRTQPLRVHLKVDTGMHRVGCAPADAPGLIDAIGGHGELELTGICTHLAVADERGHAGTAGQLDAFDALLAELAAAGRRPAVVHAANSAGLLAVPRSRYDLVRPGIAVYGIEPARGLAAHAGVTLKPAMSLKARVSFVKTLDAGARISYGLRYEVTRRARVATVPVGYADGVSRSLGAVGGEVLIRGRRFPIAGTVTMDQLMVDVGESDVRPGEEVVLIGEQGGERVTAAEWADRLGTIAYEVVCGIGPRVPRYYSG